MRRLLARLGASAADLRRVEAFERERDALAMALHMKALERGPPPITREPATLLPPTLAPLPGEDTVRVGFRLYPIEVPPGALVLATGDDPDQPAVRLLVEWPGNPVPQTVLVPFETITAAECCDLTRLALGLGRDALE